MHKLIQLLTLGLILTYACSPKQEKALEEDSDSMVRNAHSMVYHSEDSIIYMFGGASEREVLAELWTLDGDVWQEVSVEQNPGPRTFAGLVFDPVNSRLVLFGGSKVLFGSETTQVNLLDDTWEFKNGAWKVIETTNAPAPRAEMAMVYDPVRNKIVMFGGYTIKDGAYIKLGDTWEFSGNEWRHAAEIGPTKRHGCSIVHSPDLESVLLFGGSTVDKQYGEAAGETWAWDGQKWTKIDTNQPPGVFNSAMTYDYGNNQILRFGGWGGSSRIDETWTFQNNQWSKLEVETRPSARNHSQMVYDEKNQRLVLFGGHDGKNIFGDAWEYSEGNWKIIIDEESIERVKNRH